jgi:hypothetical protein
MLESSCHEPLICLKNAAEMGRAQSLVAAGVLWLACIYQSQADSFTLDLTTTGRPAFPTWMPERPLAAPKPEAELSFPVVPGPDDDDLALTIVFQEEVGGFLSVY